DPRSLTTFISPAFFFPCSGTLRALHSFPTRRSSDLLARQADHQRGTVDGGIDPALLLPGQIGASTRYRDHLAALAEVLRVQRPADRKSTRLNSSHVKISYAVFCLKKKNKKMQN